MTSPFRCARRGAALPPLTCTRLLTRTSTHAYARARQGAAEGNLLSTFENVQAFFLRYDSEPRPEFVKKWSVTTLEVSKNARHSDRSVVEGFWQALDHSLQMKRSTLNF